MSGGSDTKESSFIKWNQLDKERRRIFQVERTTGTETGQGALCRLTNVSEVWCHRIQILD